MGIFHTGMCGLALLLTLLVATACSPNTQIQSLNSDEQAENLGRALENSRGIIGGTPVGPEDLEAESTVGIIHKVFNELHCTGTLIAENLVLTAAHCTTHEPEMLAIQFDPTRAKTVSELSGKTIRQVIAGKTHPRWAKNNFQGLYNYGDLAILRFEGELPQGFKPAKLNTDLGLLKDGGKLILVGFGLTNGPLRTIAMELNRTVSPVANARFSETEFTVDQRLGTGVCRGDSGGPAYALTDEDELILVGVTSRGHEDPTGTCDMYGVFTSTAANNEWILAASLELQSDDLIGQEIPQPF